MSKCMIKTAALILLAALFFLSSALGESYEATTMRLLRYDGNVEILDASGSARFVMENARFNSGESMQTGSASSASVGLDSTKIVTLDAETQVDFAKEASHLQMTLRQGTLFLDVQEKLDENEVLDIQTTTMTVGIRGTIVFISEEPEK
nr:FecR family protein [Clostridiales bacterium]